MWTDTREQQIVINQRQAELRGEAAAARRARKPGQAKRHFAGLHLRNYERPNR
jgi:hypothetical protein